MEEEDKQAVHDGGQQATVAARKVWSRPMVILAATESDTYGPVKYSPSPLDHTASLAVGS